MAALASPRHAQRATSTSRIAPLRSTPRPVPRRRRRFNGVHASSTFGAGHSSQGLEYAPFGHAGDAASASQSSSEDDARAVASTSAEPQLPQGIHRPPFRVESRGRRVVAVGDLHGDWRQSLAALAVAGVIDAAEASRIGAVEQGNGEGAGFGGGGVTWTGGDALVVQVGDVLDRGDDEFRLLGLMRSLKKQAIAAGGDLFMLHGNHEAMNVMGDFRYVTLGGFREVALYYEATHGPRDTVDPWTLKVASTARFELFAPGGKVAVELASNPTVLQIDDTLFAHAGVLPQHVRYGLERINSDMCRWMAGVGPMPGPAVNGDKGVYWTRVYGRQGELEVCEALDDVLDATGCSRLVVGHTPQEFGANCVCGDKVWRIDVGLSRGIFNGEPQVLEITAAEPGSDADADDVEIGVDGVRRRVRVLGERRRELQ